MLAGHKYPCLYREWTLVLAAVSPEPGLGLGATQGKLCVHSGNPVTLGCCAVALVGSRPCPHGGRVTVLTLLPTGALRVCLGVGL